MREFEGRLALVTGAARGIGRATALALAQRGANLILVDIDRAELQGTVRLASQNYVRVEPLVADLANTHEVQQVVEHARGSLDLLVNNAGMAYFGPTERMTADQWNRLMAVNLLAPIQLTSELLPTLLARPQAHIVNVCSIAGLMAMPRLTAYHTSKFGLVGFSEALRAEFGPQGLGVTALCPGLVRTNIFQSACIVSYKSAPRMPDWMYWSPEQVAERLIRAIQRNQGLVILSSWARALWRLKRLSPGLIDAIQQFRRRQPMKSNSETEPTATADGTSWQVHGAQRPAMHISTAPRRTPSPSE